MSGELLAILVGGQARRMGGQAKGLLQTAERKTIVENLSEAFADASHAGSVALVGEPERTRAYDALGLPTLSDDPAGIGPLGGIASALQAALQQRRRLVVVSCDLPYVDAELFRALLNQSPNASVVAPRVQGRWEPTFSRFDAEKTGATVLSRIELGKHRLQGLLDDLGAVSLTLSAQQIAKLRDWDTLQDVGKPLSEGAE